MRKRRRGSNKNGNHRGNPKQTDALKVRIPRRKLIIWQAIGKFEYDFFRKLANEHPALLEYYVVPAGIRFLRLPLLIGYLLKSHAKHSFKNAAIFPYEFFYKM